MDQQTGERSQSSLRERRDMLQVSPGLMIHGFPPSLTACDPSYGDRSPRRRYCRRHHITLCIRLD